MKKTGEEEAGDKEEDWRGGGRRQRRRTRSGGGNEGRYEGENDDDASCNRDRKRAPSELTTRRKLASRAATVRKIVTQTNHKINNLSGEGEDTKTRRRRHDDMKTEHMILGKTARRVCAPCTT